MESVTRRKSATNFPSACRGTAQPAASTPSRSAPTIASKTWAAPKRLSGFPEFLDISRRLSESRLLRRVVFLNLRAKSDSPIAIRLIPYVHDPSRTMRLLRLAPGHFRRHPQRAIDGHAHLKRRRRRKEKSAARNVEGFGEMFALVRS